MKLPRVMLADDHTILVEAFRKLLEPHYEVVAIVSDGRSLLKVAPVVKPEVILLDIAMPQLNGLDAGRQLKEKMPAVKLIYLTMNEDPDLAVAAMAAGASGYLLKKSAASELFRAIRESLKGKSYITPQIARAMRETFVRNPQAKNSQAKHVRRILTPRQREVLQLLAEGRSMKETADILRVTPRTVAFHKYRIMEVHRLKTNADLVQFAIKNHILTI